MYIVAGKTHQHAEPHETARPRAHLKLQLHLVHAHAWQFSIQRSPPRMICQLPRTLAATHAPVAGVALGACPNVAILNQVIAPKDKPPRAHALQERRGGEAVHDRHHTPSAATRAAHLAHKAGLVPVTGPPGGCLQLGRGESRQQSPVLI